MNIDGAVALVTGAATGLGQAVARKLASEKATVVLVDQDHEAGHAAASELGGLFVHADVTDEDAISAAVEQAANLGALRVVINCAGIGDGARIVDRKGKPHDLGLFRRVIAINLTGAFNVLRLAAARMTLLDENADGERGVVINTASIAGIEGQVGQAAYAASKGGIIGLTLAAARDLGPHGIRVVTIAPGVFGTAMSKLLPRDVRADLLDSLAFPFRTGRPDEFANLVAAVIQNPYLNGETIRLDGGLRMTHRNDL